MTKSEGLGEPVRKTKGRPTGINLIAMAVTLAAEHRSKNGTLRFDTAIADVPTWFRLDAERDSWRPVATGQAETVTSGMALRRWPEAAKLWSAWHGRELLVHLSHYLSGHLVEPGPD